MSESKVRIREMPSQIAGVRLYRMRMMQILASTDNGVMHISASHPKRMPTWEEMYRMFEEIGNRNEQLVMILPPKKEYVNLHDNCLHLFEVPDTLKKPSYEECETVQKQDVTITYGKEEEKWVLKVESEVEPSWEKVRDARYDYTPGDVSMAIVWKWHKTNPYCFEMVEVEKDKLSTNNFNLGNPQFFK